MVEIEIGVLKSQCLDRRISDRETLCEQIEAWQQARNDDRATINGLFTVDVARDKMARVYPSNPL